MIIDGTYFYGVLSVGVNWDTASDSPTRIAEMYNLNSYIALYEKKYLALILGRNMSREFIDYLGSENDGVEKWNKLKDLLSVKGESPIANYVYFHYVRRCGVKQTQTGTINVAGDDAASPNNLLVSAWNDMVDMNMDIYDFLKSSDLYKGFEFNTSMLDRINSMGI